MPVQVNTCYTVERAGSNKTSEPKDPNRQAQAAVPAIWHPDSISEKLGGEVHSDSRSTPCTGMDA